VNKLIIEASCEVDGVEYHAVSAPVPGECTGCAAEERGPCLSLDPCSKLGRADRSHVIWVRAE
jgi:hypothetical protein